MTTIVKPNHQLCWDGRRRLARRSWRRIGMTWSPTCTYAHAPTPLSKLWSSCIGILPPLDWIRFSPFPQFLTRFRGCQDNGTLLHTFWSCSVLKLIWQKSSLVLPRMESFTLNWRKGYTTHSWTPFTSLVASSAITWVWGVSLLPHLSSPENRVTREDNAPSTVVSSS